jgi:tRNA pseudouridine38-40 synthase
VLLAQSQVFSYILELRYVGTHFHGWQKQPAVETIQSQLEQALFQIGHKGCETVAASRTDAGVHAKMQIVLLRTSTEIKDFYRFAHSLNSLMHQDIRIMRMRAADADFHPLKDITSKIYHYTLHVAPVCDPFLRPFVWHHTMPLDMAAMHAFHVHLKGEHDFSSFCASDSTARTRIRHVLDTSLIDREDVLVFVIEGKGFLKHMVRSIVGLMVQVGLGRMSADEATRVWQSKKRPPEIVTAPAQGLSLFQIKPDLF